ncbi:MAG: hypothetical protein U9R02_01855 [Thermodesulfobacteriota bacterium]|nr:hypothetical protein [Thermodesulfobacteriota bacterium]
MKKFTIIGMALCLAFALAAPVMAVDADFSGHYRVKGFYTSHWDLRETSASNAYMDMQFRLQTVFKVNDILSVTTRFDALDDEVWGDDPNGDEGAIDFDRAYMTIKAPVGMFVIGRMLGGPLGNDFTDFEYEGDRIIFITKIDALKVVAIFQKNTEGDSTDLTSADKDRDDYFLVGIYNAEDITAGLGFFFTNDKRKDNETSRFYILNPYFNTKFGPLALQGEVFYKWGKTEFDPIAAGGTGDPDLDKDAIAYNLEASYNLGMASVMAGYAFFSGDNDGATDNENNEFEYGVGDNWRRLFILTSDEDPVLCENLGGGAGNLSTTGRNTQYGAKIFYGGASVTPMENLQLGLVVGLADNDEVPSGWEDDIGVEYDLTLNWKIYDNLTYSAIAAYLDAGDAWQLGNKSIDIENTYALFHQLELAF